MMTKDNINPGKRCHFCTNNVRDIDYKDIETLKTFLDGHYRIIKHKKTAVCSLHQRRLGNAIKRARFMALLPFISG
jgi:small subunit ribosomal protein S18